MSTRRAVITLLGGVTAWPLAALAQQPAMPVIGFLGSGSLEAYAPYVAGFRRGLSEAGFVEGQNVSVEYRWAQGHYDRLATLVGDLIERRVAVIVASGGPPPAIAAKSATSTVPIVFSSIDDPVRLGLVASLNRPGGNATGMSLFRFELVTKQLELARELAPKASMVAVLVNPTQSNTEHYLSDLHQAADNVGQQLAIVKASTSSEIDANIKALPRGSPQILLVTPDTLFNTQREHLIALASSERIAVIAQFREFAASGALASYGPNVGEAYREIGAYTGRILNGAKPAELPVIRPTKFELVINLKTVKALDLKVPDALLATADEVIE
jgi:putative ABC transport system substrate-binding protein